MCGLPGSPRVVSGASPLLPPAPHPPDMTASVRRWKIPRRHKPAPPRSLGETETRRPGFESLLGPGLWARACLNIPWRGGAGTPFLGVRLRLTRCSHSLRSHGRAGTLSRVLPGSSFLPEPVSPHCSVALGHSVKTGGPGGGSDWGGVCAGSEHSLCALGLRGQCFQGPPPRGNHLPPNPGRGSSTCGVAVGAGTVAEANGRWWEAEFSGRGFPKRPACYVQAAWEQGTPGLLGSPDTSI